MRIIKYKKRVYSNISGVKIIGGLLAVISGILLVLFFAKLDELISRRYLAIFEVLCLRQLYAGIKLQNLTIFKK